MGRRKIDMVHIDNARQRQLTYTKRKQGLIRKATELAVLCGAEVGIILFGEGDKMTIYSSSTMDTIVDRWKAQKPEETEVRPTARSHSFAAKSRLLPYPAHC